MDIPKIQVNGSADVVLDLNKLHQECFVDLSEEIKPQPIAISIGTHHYRGDNYPTPFGSYGDFSCIVGASKSKKTFLKSMIEASYVGGRADMFTGDIKGHHGQGKYVISIDTEQSKFHSQRVFRRVAEMCGYLYPNYIPFYLREKSPEERMLFCNWIFTESKYKDNLGLVIIDGIADLVSDFNSVEQSNELVTNLLNWSGSTQSHILTVLHRNFGSNKPVGHVGSAVLKKAETVAFVEKEDDHVKVTSEYSRNYPFDPFTFWVDPQDALPKWHEPDFPYEPKQKDKNGRF